MIMHYRSKRTLLVSFITAIAVANVSGPQYVYPTFGTALTTRFHWSVIENSIVSFATFMGLSFSGPFCAWMIETYGFQRTLLASSVTAFLAFNLLAQTYAGHLPSHYILCSIYLALTGAAAATTYLVALDSQAHNFKSSRGMSMGLTAASLGVSGLVFAQINDFFFKSNKHDDDSVYSFILFYATTGAVILVIGSFILGPLPDAPVQQEERLVEDYVSTISSMSSSSTRVEESRPLLNNKIVSADNIIQDYDEPNLSGVAFFTDPIAFALTGALLVILGLGYIYLANIGQLLLSLSTLEQRADASGLQHLRNMHVSLFSISNCLSRCFFGALSDILDRKLGIHRVWLFWMASIGLVLNLLYLVTGISNTDELVPCTIFTAVLYGNVFGVAPAAISEFGTKTFARNWGWIMFAPAIGGQLFNIIFGAVYDREAAKQGQAICSGSICFQDTFIVGIFASLLCMAMLSLAIYKKKLYKRTSFYYY